MKPTTTKHLSVSNAPAALVKCIHLDMKREGARTAAPIIRRILLQHYGLLNGQRS